MEWTTIIVPVCTIIGTSITIVSLLNKKFDKIETRLNSIDQRLSRLEGAFDERGHWEGKFFNSQKDIKEN